MNFQPPVSQSILTAVSGLDRFRGEWSARHDIPRERLARLEEAAKVLSVAASARLSGIRVTDIEVAGLLRDRTIPLGDADEMLGYAAAIGCELPGPDDLLGSDDLRRLHAVLTGAEDASARSPWRESPLHREAFDPQGKATGRVFPTLPPWMIPEKIEDLLTWFEYEVRAGDCHPVLAISTFVLGFLAACPFERYNARMARLLLGRLMRRAGYDYVRYASVESQIEDLRETYNDTFGQAQTGFWMGEANLEPWLVFVLEVLERQRGRVEAKAELEREAVAYPPLQRAILETVYEHGDVDAGLLLKATGANRNTLKDNLRRLVERGVLEKTGQRRGTRYRLAPVDPVREPDGSR
jgi:Fic family protein